MNEHARYGSNEYEELRTWRRKARIRLTLCLILCIGALPISVMAGSAYAALLSAVGIVVAAWKLSKIPRS